MKNKSIFFLFLFSFLFTTQVSASITNGTIDTTSHYAWGENVGWIDFKNVTITDSSLAGSAYGENIGWIDLSTITNTSAGTLGGYAWSENTGWIDFSKVTIDTSGTFSGSAYGENIGWITFDTNNAKVTTDWRPLSARPVASHTSGGGYMPGFGPRANLTIINPSVPSGPTALTVPPACTLTTILKQGSKGDEVKCLQTKLNQSLNLSESFRLSPDGIFGKNTKKVVITFQTKNKLTPDGIVGLKTRTLLN